MAQSLKELVEFTETVGYSSLPVENRNKIQMKILRLQHEELKIQREVEEKKAKELRQKAEDDAFAILRSDSISEIHGAMNGFIPIYSRNKVPFTVDFLRNNIGTVTFNCDQEPHFSYRDLKELSKRLGTDTITFSVEKHTTRYDLDYDNNWTFTIRFPWNNK
jgi:hypothetical protein